MIRFSRWAGITLASLMTLPAVFSQQPSAEAWFKTGSDYANGRGVIRSYLQAADYYRKAAESNYPPAQAALAQLYEQGLGVPFSLKEAGEWYLKAADRNDVASQVRVAHLYETGAGLEKNPAQAMLWYKRAAPNSPEAELRLGQIYLQGLLQQPANREEGLKLVLQAAQVAYPPACAYLGQLYADGKDLPRDNVTAYMWLHLAAVRGYHPAFKLRDELGRGMSDKERDQAYYQAAAFDTIAFSSNPLNADSFNPSY